MSIFLSFFSIPGLKLSAVLVTVLLSELMTIHSIHQAFTVYQDIAMLPTKSLNWTLDHTFWHFSSLDSTVDCMGGGGAVSNRLGLFKITKLGEIVWDRYL